VATLGLTEVVYKIASQENKRSGLLDLKLKRVCPVHKHSSDLCRTYYLQSIIGFFGNFSIFADIQKDNNKDLIREISGNFIRSLVEFSPRAFFVGSQGMNSYTPGRKRTAPASTPDYLLSTEKEMLS